ncbi:MAG: 2,3-bisphosphoglycerate-dependent phosphoglycerate mutase [Patescibacteria group bacterium]|nr:2,3-bisphosphoglycerate-dependent phosphoglycerate mutase [Patescibacteria group bacterium]
MANYLFLIRHGASEWNELGLWTGWTDVGLTPKGFEEARTAGKKLRGVKLDRAHVSPLKRAKQTLVEAVSAAGQPDVPVQVSGALLERDYGRFTAKNKWQVKEEIGSEAFEKLRRGWDVHVPEGETLKMVHERVAPYFDHFILPELREGKNVVIAAHGNTLRALIKHLEHVPDGEIHKVEIGTGEMVAYEMKNNRLLRRNVV